VGVPRDFPNFSGIPYYLGNALSYEVQIWQIYSQRTCEQKPFNHLRERERGRIQGRPNFFSVPPIISGTCRATNFKFGTYIHSVYPTKRLFEIWEKRERGCIQGLPKFFHHPLLSQEHVELRTSNLARIFTAFIAAKTF